MVSEGATGRTRHAEGRLGGIGRTPQLGVRQFWRGSSAGSPSGTPGNPALGGPPLQREDSRHLVGKGPNEAGQLVEQGSLTVEVKVPPVRRKPVVANIGDTPVGRRFDVQDEIDAAIIETVERTAAEEHLAAPTVETDLAGSEAERHQNGVKELSDWVKGGFRLTST